MRKYQVTVSVSTTAYVGDVEASDPQEAWKKGRELCKGFKEKYIEARDADESRLYFDDLDSVVPAKDGDDYVPVKWKG